MIELGVGREKEVDESESKEAVVDGGTDEAAMSGDEDLSGLVREEGKREEESIAWLWCTWGRGRRAEEESHEKKREEIRHWVGFIICGRGKREN